VIHDFQVDIDDVSAIEVVPSILQVMQATTGMGFVAVARVTEERWVACAVLDMIDFGLGPGGELTVKSTICDEIRQDHQLVAVDHFSENPIWIGHHTPLQYGLQSYISVPIILGDGSFFGTLCAVDPNPAQVDNPRVIGMAKLFADLIARHLDARRHLVETEQRLTTELETSHLRDQFIAILGHDIKNPVASIDAGARLLRKSVTDPQGRTILSLMEQSVKRVSNIVDNVMDFARGLGGGMALRSEFTPVGEVLEAIVAEFSQLYPERRIETSFAVPDALYVDRGRLGQLFANLLSNAILHGDKDSAIRCGAGEAGGVFELWVANGGVPIPGEMISGIFLPFKRRGVQGEGLGLGLYIAAEIARAHGGTLSVVSDARETRFTMRVPAMVSATENAAE
jgi:signal transduction histidine kinase